MLYLMSMMHLSGEFRVIEPHKSGARSRFLTQRAGWYDARRRD
jgi:hypothetical protein